MNATHASTMSAAADDHPVVATASQEPDIAGLCKDPALQQVLDDLVHDQASCLATAVNNDGIKAQIEFLVHQRGMTEQTIAQHLEEARQE